MVGSSRIIRELSFGLTSSSRLGGPDKRLNTDFVSAFRLAGGELSLSRSRSRSLPLRLFDRFRNSFCKPKSILRSLSATRLSTVRLRSPLRKLTKEKYHLSYYFRATTTKNHFNNFIQRNVNGNQISLKVNFFRMVLYESEIIELTSIVQVAHDH